MRPPANCCGCTVKTRAGAGTDAPRKTLRPRTRLLDRRPREAHPLRHAGLSPDRARRQDRIRISSFGTDGVVDLKLGDDQEIDPLNWRIGLHAAPVVAGDIVIVGAAHKAGDIPKSKTNVKGYVRGFDVRTGKRLWIFHTIPKPGEFGYDTWEKDSADYTGNTGVVGPDQRGRGTGDGVSSGGIADRRLLWRPSSRATACSARASWRSISRRAQRKWHYQLVHHGIWDMDIPCAPMLVDITVDGRTVQSGGPAHQAGVPIRVRSRHRQAHLADRGRGPCRKQSTCRAKSIRPHNRSQPSHRLMTARVHPVDDLIDFTPELRAEAVKITSRYKIGPIFTPASA